MNRFSNEELLNFSEVEHDLFDKKRVVKQLVSPDGYNSDPNSYQVINDGGIDVYVRTFTIDMLPKSMKFASTWSAVANFEGATTSIFIEPLSQQESSKQLDNHVSELDAEIERAEKPEVGDRNRSRKLRKQMFKTEEWAEKIENDEDVFFKVGFLITIKEKSLQELNLKSDTLHNEAIDKGIAISGCYGVQEEAFLSNFPLNSIVKNNKSSITYVVKWHLFNREALASLYNHISEKLVHDNGVPIGRGLYDAYPNFWDPYDRSHINGYSVCICGPQGVGKSTLAKTLSARLIPWGYRFVSIDSHSIGGKGEYTHPALVNNGVVYKIANNSPNIANMFDVNIEKIPSENGKSEVEILNLGKKIDFLELSILTMLQSDKADFKASTYISDILQQAIREMYAAIGVLDGKPESIFRTGEVMHDGIIMSGRVKKDMPILSDCYKQILINSRSEKNVAKREVYDLILSGLTRWVKGVYYSEETLEFYTKEEYYELPFEEIKKKKVRFIEKNGVKEYVMAVEGASTFFDGQSTVSIDEDRPFTSFDISALTQREKKVARAVLMPYIEEYFINPNNEDVRKAEKLVVIVDEAHEQFKVGEMAREQCETLSRTCRKKHVGLWWISQACADFDKYESTKTIFKLSDVKFVFKQSRADEEFLKKALPLSDNQRERIYNLNGIKQNDASKYSKPGQVCLIDSDSAYFIQLELMPEEELIIETDMRKLASKYGKEAVFWEDIA